MPPIAALAAAAAGAASVGTAGLIVGQRLPLFPPAVVVGMLGMPLGTKRYRHRCGQAAQPGGGRTWITDDAV